MYIVLKGSGEVMHKEAAYLESSSTTASNLSVDTPSIILHKSSKILNNSERVNPRHK